MPALWQIRGRAYPLKEAVSAMDIMNDTDKKGCPIDRAIEILTKAKEAGDTHLALEYELAGYEQVSVVRTVKREG